MFIVTLRSYDTTIKSMSATSATDMVASGPWAFTRARGARPPTETVPEGREMTQEGSRTINHTSPVKLH